MTFGGGLKQKLFGEPLFSWSYDQGILQLAASIDYYVKALLNQNFFYRTKRLREKDKQFTEIERSFRNKHWDRFQAFVDSLSGKEKPEYKNLIQHTTLKFTNPFESTRRFNELCSPSFDVIAIKTENGKR